MNNKGFAEVAILYGVIVLLAALFIPNPISSSLGVGIRPNKTVSTEKVDLIKNPDGTIIGTKTTVSDADIQQHVGFWEWLKSLPFLVIILMVLGFACPAVATVYHTIWGKTVAEYKDLSGETKRIVVSVKKGLETITDPTIKQNFLNAMSTQQDQSTKDLVKELLKGV